MVKLCGTECSHPQILAAALCLYAASASSAPAADLMHLIDNSPEVPTLSHYGGIGLLDTRTARFLPDGYFSASVSVKNPDDRIGITFQALPWLETTFRWANDYAIRQSSGHGQGADRSFDAKVRLSQEGNYLPAIAVGLQDIVGTGVYAGQYVVASKHIGAFDVSMGLGWGRLGSRGAFSNPFGLLSDRFKRPPSLGSGSPGGLNPSNYFRGPEAGVFGGFEYTPPIHNVRIQVEYSSDAYTQEKRESGKDFSFPLNVGVSYRPLPWLDLGVSWMHGHEIGVRLSTFFDAGAPETTLPFDVPPGFKARDSKAVAELANKPAGPLQAPTRYVDLTRQDTPLDWTPSAPAATSAPRTTLQPRPSPATAETPKTSATTTQSMRLALEDKNIPVKGLRLSEGRIETVIANEDYRRDAEAVARTVRALSALAPPEVDTFDIITTRAQMPLTQVIVPRRGVDTLARKQSTPADLLQSSTIRSAGTSLPDYTDFSYPIFDWELRPGFEQSFFAPENPLLFRVTANADLSVTPFRGFTLATTLSASVFDTYDSIRRSSTSALPHVRSDFAEYLKQGRYGIASMTASYDFKILPEVYARATAGLLEDMYAGIGGEILYRPFGARWAIGIDGWRVQQREFDRLFGLKAYQANTGHISLYYNSPWHGISFRIQTGMYLAKDIGSTFTVYRKFDNGVEIGGWFTLTNVSAARFGEGSFDKGIRIRIPLESLITPFPSQSIYALDLRPIQRDGGQMLNGGQQLYDLTDPSSYGAMTTQWQSVFKP